jgi:cell division protein FtsQ
LLPLVVGQGAEHAASDLLRFMARFPDIAHRVESAVFIAERRWNLHLKDGLEVMLPENDLERALSMLADFDRSKNLLSRDIVAIDLRLPDRVAVRQSDAAAKARDGAVDAAKNAKKKNGSAA